MKLPHIFIAVFEFPAALDADFFSQDGEVMSSDSDWRALKFPSLVGLISLRHDA